MITNEILPVNGDLRILCYRARSLLDFKTRALISIANPNRSSLLDVSSKTRSNEMKFLNGARPRLSRFLSAMQIL